MDRVTAQIADGRFDVQAAEPRSDELGHLGSEIDRMAGRLESFVRKQKRFLGDIAHELCAPIARIQFALGILAQKAEEGQRAHMAALHDEIQEMSGRRRNELLSFSKPGMQPGSAALTQVRVAEIAEKAIAREAFAGATVQMAIGSDLRATANPALLLRALSNVLLRNAVRYAGSDGADLGHCPARGRPGVDRGGRRRSGAAAPFYRPEAARTRETGGAGLGLAIVRTCVEACSGRHVATGRLPD